MKEAFKCKHQSNDGKFIQGFFNPFRAFLLAIIILTMYNNLEHSASVYLSIAGNSKYSDWYNTLQSYMVVIVIDLAVIAFIISSKKKESKIFAWVLFAINCLFFNVFQSIYFILEASLRLIEFKNGNPLVIIEEVNALIAKIVFSGLFSYCIHRFSFLWFEKKNDIETDYTIDQSPSILEMNEEKMKVDEDLNILRLKHIEVLNETIELVTQNNFLTSENEILKKKLTRKKQ